MAVEFVISPELGESLVFSAGLPKNYCGPTLPDANSYSSTKTDLAHFSVQELCGEGYTVRLTVGKIMKRSSTKSKMGSEGLYCKFMFRNSCRRRLDNMGAAHIREGQFECFYAQPADGSLLLEEGKEFKMLDLYFSPELLNELVPFFPELESAMGNMKGTMLTKKPLWMPLSMMEVANQLLNCKGNEHTGQFYFDLKVRELLYQIMERTLKQDFKQMYFTPFEVRRIHEAKRILQEHIACKPPSIRSLSKMVALNEFKLKKGFRQYFDESIGHWMHEQKLQHSRHLILNTNRPVKQICTMVGYPLTSNFITAFRKRFGVTPGDLRKR